MLGMFRYVEAIAPSPEPVLILGETGVGKELVAEGVHRASERSGPLVTVNVAGLDSTAFSDTLLGGNAEGRRKPSEVEGRLHGPGNAERGMAPVQPAVFILHSTFFLLHFLPPPLAPRPRAPRYPAWLPVGVPSRTWRYQAQFEARRAVLADLRPPANRISRFGNCQSPILSLAPLPLGVFALTAVFGIHPAGERPSAVISRSFRVFRGFNCCFQD